MPRARSAIAALLIGALTATSTATLAAPALPVGSQTQSAVIKVNQHHKKSHKNWSRPSVAQHQRRRKNNEAVAIGVGIATVLGAIALSQQAQSDDGTRRECRRLRWKCREGRGWACRKFDDACR